MIEFEKIEMQEFEKLKDLFPDNEKMWNKYKNKRFEQFEKKEIDVFIIKDNEKFIGEIPVNYKSHELKTETIPNKRVYLEAFRVDKKYRGQGLGQKLVNYCIDYLIGMGYTEFTIGVEDNNEIAKHIYFKLGFTNAIDKGYGDEFDPSEYTLYLKDINNSFNNKNVTVVIDGQAGSCGKGKICGYLSKIDNFTISTNNWATNAGHTYVSDSGEKIVVSHLPMAVLNPNCKLLLNAGSIITPEILFEEIRNYKKIIGNRKIYIHPRAMIILEKHREEEKRIIRSGSTFKGCGVAQSEKIIRKPDIILAKDYFENIPLDLKDIIEIVDTAKMINECNQSILIEGAQGQDLDINYGLDYPNVTSRMCSASQLIADSGVSPFKVKDIYMIIRPYPIRISNETNIGEKIYSGDYAKSKEITWEEVKKRCGCNVDLIEYTTVTKKVRRVFEMNWERLKYNVMINRPTQIVLNFAQYIDWNAYKCKNYNMLPEKVIKFIKRIEDETNIPVTLIGTGECESDIIDLRKEKGRKI